MSKSEFMDRLFGVLEQEMPTPSPVAHETTATVPSVPTRSPEANIATPMPALTGQDTQSRISAGSSEPAAIEGGQSPVVRELLAERSARLEQKKKELDDAKKLEQRSKAAAKREALEADNPADSKRSADVKYALMQKKRQQDARNERARILKRVEDDKAERRAKEALRKEQVRAATESDALQLSKSTKATSSKSPISCSKTAVDCALQVRLFDGTTIRSRFPSQNTIREDVRPWIDGQRVDGDSPYTFKHILTPLPNRTITITEEEDTLQSLGLTPNATLILVPIRDYTSAYEGGTTGYVSKGISTGLGFVSSSVNFVTGTLGSLLGGARNSGESPKDEHGSTSTKPVAPKVRTLQDQREKPEEHQLYNGNTVSDDNFVRDSELSLCS